jgi:hypothetical protein
MRGKDYLSVPGVPPRCPPACFTTGEMNIMTVIKKMKCLVGALSLCACAGTGVGSAFAAAPKPEPVVLTAGGEALQARYAAMLADLREETVKALPAVDERKKAAVQQAREGVKKATAGVATARKPLGKIQTAKTSVDHAKGKWIGGAEKNIVAAEEELKKATSDTEREAAQKKLTAAQADLEAGKRALVEHQSVLDAVRADEAKYIQALQAAEAGLVQALADELKASKAMLADVMAFLSSDKLDAHLVKGAVLANATPSGLAEFAQQGKEQEKLVDDLLADTALMKAMLEAGGPRGGKYGPAMKIYNDILKASTQAREGVGQRLALATSLEHGVPIGHESWTTEYTRLPGTPARKTIVDPVRRYLHFQKAFLAGELDESFKEMSVWEYRHVVDSDATDEMLAWGREMLRNYRPDHILTPDRGWRYSRLVRTDVSYASSTTYQDNDSLEYFQNVLKNGGICGRRALCARFILQCFGNPTWGVGQPGHAATGRWTPDGWVVNLGAGWDKSSGPGDNGQSRSGTDFVLEAQARKYPREYGKVLRAQWVGDILGEPKSMGEKDGSGSLWNDIALLAKKVIVADAKSAQLAALGAELGEANESAAAKAKAVVEVDVTDADRKVVVASDGVITVPSAACTGGVSQMKSFLGGLQAFAGDMFMCNVEVTRPGTYRVSARVVTVHAPLQVPLKVNDGKDAYAMTIPYTLGKWQQTEPVDVTLVAGKNVLNFEKPARGFSFKDITLKQVK